MTSSRVRAHVKLLTTRLTSSSDGLGLMDPHWNPPTPIDYIQRAKSLRTFKHLFCNRVLLSAREQRLTHMLCNTQIRSNVTGGKWSFYFRPKKNFQSTEKQEKGPKK